MHAHFMAEPRRGLCHHVTTRPLVVGSRPLRWRAICALVLAHLALASCASTTPSPDSAGAQRSPTVHTAAVDSAAAPATGPDGAGTPTRTALVWVNGMGCPLCATNVDQQLKRVRGVESVKINLGTGIVSVSLDPERIPAEAELAKAVRDSGFTLVRIQMPGSAGAAEGGGGA